MHLLALVFACESSTTIDLKGASASDDTAAGDDTATDSAAGDTAIDTGDGDPLPRTPATCREVRDATPGAPDGNYTLYLGNAPSRPWTAWCAAMATSPAEYLTLPENRNASEFVTPDWNYMSVTTVYARVRLDPVTLLIDISDATFATSSGGFTFGGGTVTSMPFGVAMSCNSTFPGDAAVDLSGTPFRVLPNAFVVAGYEASGSATYSPSGQVVTLVGGGYCGWISPSPEMYNPINGAGTFQLPLAYID